MKLAGVGNRCGRCALKAAGTTSRQRGSETCTGRWRTHGHQQENGTCSRVVVGLGSAMSSLVCAGDAARQLAIERFNSTAVCESLTSARGGVSRSRQCTYGYRSLSWLRPPEVGSALVGRLHVTFGGERLRLLLGKWKRGKHWKSPRDRPCQPSQFNISLRNMKQPGWDSKPRM